MTRHFSERLGPCRPGVGTPDGEPTQKPLEVSATIEAEMPFASRTKKDRGGASVPRSFISLTPGASKCGPVADDRRLQLITCGRNYGDDCFTTETPETQRMRRENFEKFLCALRVSAVSIR